MLEDGNRSAADTLRQVCASVIMSDPATYSAAFLGKDNGEYVQYILNPEKWGGGIELAILSDYYKAEIAAIDIETTHLYVYGEGKGYDRRVYLLYSGIHYDALAVRGAEADGDDDESRDRTVFVPDDRATHQAVVALAKQLKQDKQYTNVQRFALRCAECAAGLVGAVEARDHAKATGHVNFVEYK